MFSLRSPFRMVLVAAIMLALATTLWLSAGERVAEAQGTTTCAPTATDQVYTPSIEVTGTAVSWDAHPDACAYRVFLSSSPSGERIDTLESTTDTSYTIPAAEVMTGAKYKVTIRILGSDGRPAGTETRYWFYHHPTLPQCAVVTDSSAGPAATPTPAPSAASSACNLLPVQKDISVAALTNAPVVAFSANKFTTSEQKLKCVSTGTCTSSAEGISAIDGSIMSQMPRKATDAADYWDGYHLFNRMTVSNPAKADVDCSTANRDGDLDGTDDDDTADDLLPVVPYIGPESIAAGFVTGNLAGRVYKNELVVLAYYQDQELTGQTNTLRCIVKRTGMQNGQHAGIYTQIGHVGGGWWRVRAWYGQWVELARFHTSWEEAPDVSHGPQIWADNRFFRGVHAPLNQISRVSLTIDGQRYPWVENALPTAFRGRSQSLVVGALAFSDNRGLDYTSITTCVNKQGTNFCNLADRSLGRVRTDAAPPPSESDLMFEMIEELSAAASTNAIYLAAELELSACLSGTSTVKDTDGGPRAPTLPFSTVTDNYGTYKSRLVSGGDCHDKAQAMFDAYETASKAELTTLRNAQPRPAWADMLDHTVYGADFANSVGNSEQTWRYVDLLDTADNARAGSARNAGLPDSETGDNCLSFGETIGDTSDKLDKLNCLVFDTPYSFWYNLLGSTADNNSLAMTSDDRYDWLGFEQWDCTLWPDAEVALPACLRHDVAWATLRKIVGNDGDGVKENDEDDDTIDATWNVRNKYAADEQFGIDIAGCDPSSFLTVLARCDFAKLARSKVMVFGVRRINTKFWPHTEQDIKHVKEVNHEFIECPVPVPRVANVGLARQSDGTFLANWQLQPGCVSEISVDLYLLNWRVRFTDEGITTISKQTSTANGDALSTTFSPIHQQQPIASSDIQSVQLLSIRLAPNDRDFGGFSYPAQQYTNLLWVRGE